VSGTSPDTGQGQHVLPGEGVGGLGAGRDPVHEGGSDGSAPHDGSGDPAPTPDASNPPGMAAAALHPQKGTREPQATARAMASCWGHPSRRSAPAQGLGQTLPCTGSDGEDLSAGRARTARGRAAPARRSSENSQSPAARYSPGQARWLGVAQSHEPRCRGAGGEQDPVPLSLQPQGHSAPSRARVTEGFAPSPGSRGQAAAPLALPLAPQQWKPRCPARGRPPKPDSVSGGWGDAGPGCAGAGRLCTPGAWGQGGAEPHGVWQDDGRTDGCETARRDEGPRAGGDGSLCQGTTRHRVVGDGRRGLPVGWGGFAHPISLRTSALCSAPPGRTPPPGDRSAPT